MVVAPGFAEYRRALETVDCAIETFFLREEDDWQLTDRILPALTAELDCLFLCTPNNPTGLLPDGALLTAIAERCRALEIALVLDEAFLDFIPDEAALSHGWRSIRTSGCCDRLPNSMPFPAFDWAIC